MKKYLTLIILLAATTFVKAQTPKADTSVIYTAVEHSGTFPGGIEQFYNYIKKNSKYPIAERNQPAKHAFFTFVILRDGTLSDIRMLRGTGNPDFDNEAIRLLKTSPKWQPGQQNGIKIKQQYTIPFAFLDKSN